VKKKKEAYTSVNERRRIGEYPSKFFFEAEQRGD
jgi:hypothetical protein